MKTGEWGRNSQRVCGYVLCDGQRRPPKDLRQMLVIIMECVSWACEDPLWEHEWVTEANVVQW